MANETKNNEDSIKKVPICVMCGSRIDTNGPYIKGFYDIAHICPKCAQDIHNCVENFPTNVVDVQNEDGTIPTPREIKAHLDKYIIGQDHSKMVISSAVYNHYKRVSTKNSESEIQKSCILLVGPTGTGKTEIARSIAKYLNVPFAIADATSLTQAGYVGDDVESILSKLYQAADYDVEKTERGIVFIDEIDKIGNRNGGNPSISRDVSGEGVQQALLKIIEGNDVLVPPNGGRKHPDQKMVKINTENILFICSGAFVGLDRIIMNRLNHKTVGYGTVTSEHHDIDKDKVLHYVTPMDIKKFGLIPELVGRLPIITYTDPLDKEALIKILTEPKNAIIKQYKEIFELDGIQLEFSEDVYDYIAEVSTKNETGARGLRNILEQILLVPMYELPGSDKTSFTITKKYAEDALKIAV